jgi:hypothetical protein
MRLCRDGDRAMLAFDFDLERPAKLIDGDQRAVEQALKRLAGHGNRHLRPVGTILAGARPSPMMIVGRSARMVTVIVIAIVIARPTTGSTAAMIVTGFGMAAA